MTPESLLYLSFQNMILECCSEIMALFSVDREPTPLTEVCASPLRLSGIICSPFSCVNGDTLCVSNHKSEDLTALIHVKSTYNGILLWLKVFFARKLQLVQKIIKRT